MSSFRHALALTLLGTTFLILACGSGEGQPDQPSTKPAPQDTGKPADAVKAQVQAAVATAQATADAEVSAQAEAQQAAKATDACEPREPAPLSGPSCISGSIACGETIRATTVGGSDHFDGDRYVHSYCFPTTDDSHRGTERVYAFQLAAGQRATFELSSPCADLDLAVLRWENERSCPSNSDSVSECEGQNRGGGGQASIWNNRGARYLAIVDGSDEVGANFELTVSCVDAEI